MRPTSLASWSSLVVAITLVGFSGCHRAPPTQQLVATGELVAADGKTPVAGQPIDAYRLTFVVAGGNEIERTFTEDERGDALRTNDAGTFRLLEKNLALSYDWQKDEYICQDICTEWVTTCQDVAEDVCVEQCDVVTYEECYDDCWDECETVCYDETVCDDEGCWTETVCSDDCTTYCEPVCQTVTEEQCWDECHVEVFEQCNDDCLASVESCNWVTNTYTTFPALSDIVSTRAAIRLKGQDGVNHWIAGKTLDAEAAEPYKWVERDRFRLPAP